MRLAAPQPPAAAKTPVTEKSQTPFDEALGETLSSASAVQNGGATVDTLPSGRQPFGGTRHGLVTDPAPDKPISRFPATAADALGLRAVGGAIATIDGQTFYGTDDGWSLTPPPVASAVEDKPTGEQLLGFTPEWMAEVTSVVFNESGLPAGTVYFNRKLYATEDTAQRLATVLGVKAVPSDPVPIDSEEIIPQWELDFGDGIRLNAGLVADMFMRDPQRAIWRLRAEIGA